MEKDIIMSLLSAIEELITEIRTLRSAGSAGISTTNRPKYSVVADESEDHEICVLDSFTNDRGGIAQDNPAAALVADLNEQVEKAQQELDLLVVALGEKDAKLDAARNALSDTERSLDELEKQKARLTAEIEAFERKSEQFQFLQHERSAVEEHLRAMKSEKVDFEEKSRLLASREEELRIGLEKVEHAGEFMQKLWPEWLCGGNLKYWKELIERDVFAASSPPSFSLLFAAIHTYNASIRDPDSRILLDSLRDLGRRLYQWLKDLGKTEESIAEIAEGWASAINTECVGRSGIQVAVPGNPANNKWMSFTPRSGSAPDVAIVRSWCVSDSQGRTIHRAEVTV